MALGVEVFVLSDVVGVRMIDEALYLFAFSLLILVLVFIIDLGLDVEENIPSVPATLATMALSGG